jgi:hypothetical protein
MTTLCQMVRRLRNARNRIVKIMRKVAVVHRFSQCRSKLFWRLKGAIKSLQTEKWVYKPIFKPVPSRVVVRIVFTAAKFVPIFLLVWKC